MISKRHNFPQSTSRRHCSTRRAIYKNESIMPKAARTIILPGLDGSTGMLRKFCELAPSRYEVMPLDLPAELSSYVELSDHFSDLLSGDQKNILIAESFSGPLAVLLATAQPESVAGIVLVASFVTSPLSTVTRFIPWSLLFRLPLPAFIARQFMLGKDCDHSLIDELKTAVKTISPSVLTRRVREVGQTKLKDEFRNLQCPVICLRPLNDSLIPKHCIETIKHLREDVVIHTIKGPHLILETRPGEVWNIIGEFIESLSSKEESLS